MGLIQEEEDKRYFIQLALNAGKDFLSQQTQYIHDRDAIPFYENICYILALVSSKQKENAEKAQDLLHHLLKFQIKNNSICDGAFPKYLHQYPYAKACSFQFDLYLILEELLKHHSLALGSVLANQLKKALNYFAEYLESNSLIKTQVGEGLQGLYSSKLLAKTLLPLRYQEEEILLKALDIYADYWNPSLMCYSGPCFDEYYEKNQLQLSAFDYLMSSYYHVYPSLFKKKNLLQLQSALIPYISQVKEPIYQEVKGKYKEMSFSIINREDSSLFFFNSFNSQKIGMPCKGLHLFRYLWKAKNSMHLDAEHSDALHHLVCQSTKLNVDVTYTDALVQQEIEMTFAYPLEICGECHNQEELEFFVDRHPDISWIVGDKKATVFTLGDKLYMHSQDKILEFIFSVKEGSGEVVGHLSLGNRPSQVDLKASKEFEAFDWRLCLRTLRRSSSFKIALQMKILQRVSLDTYFQKQDCQVKHPLHVTHCQHTE
jgi:hypothetical protein